MPHACLAQPKSISLITPREVTMMLAPLISLWRGEDREEEGGEERGRREGGREGRREGGEERGKEAEGEEGRTEGRRIEKTKKSVIKLNIYMHF